MKARHHAVHVCDVNTENTLRRIGVVLGFKVVSVEIEGGREISIHWSKLNEMSSNAVIWPQGSEMALLMFQHVGVSACTPLRFGDNLLQKFSLPIREWLASPVNEKGESLVDVQQVDEEIKLVCGVRSVAKTRNIPCSCCFSSL